MTKKQSRRLRKTLTLVFSAVLLVAISVGATIAYLTDTDSVANTFTVGNVEITLDEARTNKEGKPVDKDGKEVKETKDAPRVQGNEYHLVPGREIIKDPTVHVKANSEECYVRVFVKVSNWSAVKTVFAHAEMFKAGLDAGSKGYDNLFNGLFNGRYMNTTAPWWKLHKGEEDTNNDTFTFELRYMKGAGDAAIDATVPTSTADQDLKQVFGGITVPEGTTKEEIAALYTDDDKFKVEVTAQAIQAEGFETANDAWAAWPTT